MIWMGSDGSPRVKVRSDGEPSVAFSCSRISTLAVRSRPEPYSWKLVTWMSLAVLALFGRVVVAAQDVQTAAGPSAW